MRSAKGVVRILFERIVKPRPGAAVGGEAPADHPRRCELSLWDLSMLSFGYIQKGHLFSLPSGDPPVEVIVERLNSSLSIALWHFYPLAGRLATEIDADGRGMFVHIDCDDQGAGFLLATADGVTVADVLAPSEDVPSFVSDFFPMDGAINYDGRSLPLLAVQLTKLEDGFFLGYSFNHLVGDGTSFCHFLNAWAEISRSKADGSGHLSKPPVPIRFPFTHEDQFIERFSPPPLRKKIFQFTGASIGQLKARANEERGTVKISSLQALGALMWRCTTRSRRLPDDQKVGCSLAAENRRRLRPQLPPAYFGNSFSVIAFTATAGELLANDLGWAAGMLNHVVASHTDTAIRGMAEGWMASPWVYRISGLDRHSIIIGNSPQFDMYGCDFGWGKAAGLRSGSENQFDGLIWSYPGREGSGSIDLEVWLPPEVMSSLESDVEFAQVVSTAGNGE
ncbi:unnamed protein product [Spirodela intermedia]|uniref:Uncharacterized protein n=1 Tax=Spirodela intermedia TaxID=51605 RepID=A0A7I8JL82_SPIIN|nr:unnamed protein product [Spirodela intermedia]CAA6670521.1 unnamed protein product [Spirodela intermedia]